MTSSRIAVRLALGVLCGIALVILPAVFSAGTSTSTSNNNISPQIFGATRINQLYAPTASGSTPVSFLVIVLFIFLPSTVFSFAIRKWAEKRAREYL